MFQRALWICEPDTNFLRRPLDDIVMSVSIDLYVRLSVSEHNLGACIQNYTLDLQQFLCMLFMAVSSPVLVSLWLSFRFRRVNDAVA